jgi:hypothetical protein
MSICTNFGPDRPCRLARGPVSIGEWTKIRLRRITHSSTCVCLRLRNFFFCFFFLASRYARCGRYAHPTLALRARGGRAALLNACTIAIRSRGTVASSRLRRPDCAPGARGASYDLCVLNARVCVHSLLLNGFSPNLLGTYYDSL